ncbi:TPA: DUF5107 domain-containing protein [Escherichia coli]
MTPVKVWQERVEIPTYETGPQDIHPMFLENRVYQGSSGAVYPYGVTDTLSEQKTLKSWQAVWLENDYIKVMILPELGGRVHRAWDKVKQRDFVYHNEVIKPALVGLLGPWISGGIEFNWPQHHRPTTFMPVDFTLEAHEDGAQTVWVGETEPMHGLQVMTGFTLRPDRAALEIASRVYNGNATPRHFLWWANPAVKGGEGHQSVFPPDVTAVFDHGKRAVSAFPIATGTYYKVDYSAGVDISRYKNVPVPTSYMAEKSQYDFVGAWCHDEDGGLLHVANHHIAPGKKQWSWGHSEFGQAWDKSLTDNNGPYIELMTGIFADNQPDFTWLDAYEEKRFEQYFLPYHSLGMVQNASRDAVIKLQRSKRGIEWGLYAISPLNGYRLAIREIGKCNALLDDAVALMPATAIQGVLHGINPERLTIELSDADGNIVLSYQEHQPQALPLPDVAKAPLAAQDITSTDEAWFIGQHLEQYHHASRSPFDYYLRGVALDPLDYPLNATLWWLNWFDGRSESALAQWRGLCQGRDVNALMTAGQLINWGMPTLAAEMLNALDCQRTLPLYLQASLLPKAERGELVAKAIDVFPQFVRFPNTLEEVAALESIEECWFARHLLACFYYNKRSYNKAIAFWQRCVEMSPEFADGWRGLAIHAWNKQHDYELAARYLDNAYQLAPQDARLLFERDLLDKLSGATPEKRLARLENNLEIALKRDDMTAELLNLWHLTGQADKAADILATRKFHPWEGGEGKVTSQFILNQLLRAWQHLDARQPQQACELLHAALHYPENLSEGRLPGQTDNDIWFWQAICANAQGDETEATRCLRLAATGDRTINIHSYYNDQPVDYLFWQGMALRLLGEQQTAQQLFSEMKQWAQEMAKTSIEADFFAVSQPDLLSLYGDLQQQHKEKCLMVAMLASAGLGEVAQYESARAELTAINPAWPKAALFTTVMPFIFNRVH